MDIQTARERANFPRYVPGDYEWFYESYFLQANHPALLDPPYHPLQPRRRPNEGVGRLWTVWFKGETGHHATVKKTVPVSDCCF